LAEFSSVFLQIASLEGLFLSAVADRLGIWGAYGYPNVAWGSYSRFVAYTAKLFWLLPPTIVPALAFGATAAETLFRSAPRSWLENSAYFFVERSFWPGCSRAGPSIRNGETLGLKFGLGLRAQSSECRCDWELELKIKISGSNLNEPSKK